ncbi:hypothetical protein TTHERM_000706482 (macronuclear) [Tetrahymena thermophila SB210]|uniref:Uncharacterized protein n=1 Tax=Tetrahymena thermophila (strain SB210) TaxID=312017 RepID=W7X8J8_TETTS|nr:hypothetical protein TTHERM_000706482 [Tetrahymena thermophila SB210]EWS75695.1 hypothetical protein TTHERM_000706482 [Tetrahymena thermophila SB210]|eukprot:XP_012651768.1 hypothetical protein TTHERM_000706482 [Tetrahymena thermophila SB210]
MSKDFYHNFNSIKYIFSIYLYFGRLPFLFHNLKHILCLEELKEVYMKSIKQNQFLGMLNTNYSNKGNKQFLQSQSKKNLSRHKFYLCQKLSLKQEDIKCKNVSQSNLNKQDNIRDNFHLINNIQYGILYKQSKHYLEYSFSNYLINTQIYFIKTIIQYFQIKQNKINTYIKSVYCNFSHTQINILITPQFQIKNIQIQYGQAIQTLRVNQERKCTNHLRTLKTTNIL